MRDFNARETKSTQVPDSAQTCFQPTIFMFSFSSSCFDKLVAVVNLVGACLRFHVLIWFYAIDNGIPTRFERAEVFPAASCYRRSAYCWADVQQLQQRCSSRPRIAVNGRLWAAGITYWTKAKLLLTGAPVVAVVFLFFSMLQLKRP